MREADDDDLRLVAFLDDEMGEAERAELDRRLAADPTLQARLDRLRDGEAPLRDALAALLEDAPTERLAARLQSANVSSAVSSGRYGLRWAAAAALAALLFGAGFGAARVTSTPNPVVAEAPETWRQTVAEYMTLYTPETFGAAEAATSDRDFEALGQRVGVAFDGERLSLAGLSLRRGELLQFHGAPLVQIGYLDGTTPVAFCVLRDGEADAPVTTASSEGFATASWAKGGRGFMIIGKVSEDRVTALARTLQDRI